MTRHSSARLDTVVFDLGGVLIDWDPRHLYRRLFDDEGEMEAFLATVATPEWNLAQDAGRPWATAVATLAAAHPDQEAMIRAYHERWPETMAGEIPATVELLAELRQAGRRIYALSNWSAETFPVALDRFPFLAWFDAIVISGEVGVVKPEPQIFEHLIREHGVVPRNAVFVDDSAQNVAAAATLGFTALQFQDAATLRRELHALGLLGAA